MRALLAALVGVTAYVGSVTAGEDLACAVAEHLAHTESALPRVAEAIAKARALTVVVVGTASSTLPGPSGPRMAYPARLEAALAKKLPNVAVEVIADAKMRRTAADMATGFAGLLAKDKPALVVWQAGTVDAIRGVDADEFHATLEKAIEQLHAGGADVVFMNMQYSPRTEAVLSAGQYAEAMRWVALQRDVPLFDRAAMMRQWSDMGTFDLFAPTKSLDTAGRVHDCIGRLLAGFIIEAAKLSETGQKELKEFK